MATQDDYIKTALRLPRHLHADASVAAEAAGRSLNAELIHRIGQSADLAHLHRVIEQLTQTLKVEREEQLGFVRHLLLMYGQTLRALDEAILLAQHKNGSREDLERLRAEFNNAKGALAAFSAMVARPAHGV